jgi:hypothetical protein
VNPGKSAVYFYRRSIFTATLFNIARPSLGGGTPRSGGWQGISGDLDMNGSGKIVQLVDPSNNQDAATKRYVDSHNHGGNTNGGTSDGTHTHTITSPSNSSTVAAVTLLNITPAYNFAGGQLDAAIAKQDLTASSSGSGHYHAISTDGEAGTNKNLPPYYALAFIMRIS